MNILMILNDRRMAPRRVYLTACGWRQTNLLVNEAGGAGPGDLALDRFLMGDSASAQRQVRSEDPERSTTTSRKMLIPCCARAGR